MRRDIPKLCADSLRAFAKDNYGIKLKATHAHELVAAYLGYRSRNALLADNKYPIENLAEAKVVVMVADEEIDQRRQKLEGLSPELPDSYTLGEAVYVPLFADEWWGSDNPPFRSFDKLAKVLVENNEAFRSVFRYRDQIPLHHFPIVKQDDDVVVVTVVHSYETTHSEMSRDGQTTITLPRVAGRIGFGNPQMSVGQFTGGARTTLKSLGVRS
ncbi:MAG: hypothetical protein QNJ14_09415 [Woeseiaceae bacterium]|nr:hypothetical protein [Woeseiaceae bacterium]